MHTTIKKQNWQNSETSYTIPKDQKRITRDNNTCHRCLRQTYQKLLSAFGTFTQIAKIVISVTDNTPHVSKLGLELDNGNTGKVIGVQLMTLLT